MIKTISMVAVATLLTACGIDPAARTESSSTENGATNSTPTCTTSSGTSLCNLQGGTTDITGAWNRYCKQFGAPTLDVLETITFAADGSYSISSADYNSTDGTCSGGVANQIGVIETGTFTVASTATANGWIGWSGVATIPVPAPIAQDGSGSLPAQPVVTTLIISQSTGASFPFGLAIDASDPANLAWFEADILTNPNPDIDLKGFKQ